MSGDGAHLGMSADQSLGVVLGGKEPPPNDDTKTPEQMAEWLLAAPERSVVSERTAGQEYSDGDYGECARRAAGVLLRLMRSGRLNVSDSDDGYSLAVSENPWMEDEGYSGFQWGWAFNAARYALGEPPVQNPAIVEITVAP